MHEATDFTPWLAEIENIVLLAQTVGLDLEVETVEKSVGPFRADILCKDTLTGRYVLIENQLERTDHTHLGQLMTYAAGLDAATIIWVAPRFTEEHRAALDWLNRITVQGFDFFGLEIELWRIGDSPLAPRLNLVSQPNDWAKSVRTAAEASPTSGASETRNLYLEFWSQFWQFMEGRGSPVRIGKPTGDSWIDLGLGRTRVNLVATISRRTGRCSVYLSVLAPGNREYLRLIQEQFGAQVAAVLGEVVWQEDATPREGRIVMERQSDLARRETWPELNIWLAERIETGIAFFRPIVKQLGPPAAAAQSVGLTEEPVPGQS